MPVRKLKPRNKATAPPKPTKMEQKKSALLCDVLNDVKWRSHRPSRQNRTSPNVGFEFSGTKSQSSSLHRSSDIAERFRKIIQNLSESNFNFSIYLLKKHFSHDESLAQARANAVVRVIPARIGQTKHAGDVADFHIPDGIKERHTFAEAQGPLDATVHLT